MVRYLENDLVEFIPLFNINYSIKKDLICGCFFKLNESYKDFSNYTNGLIKVYHIIINNYKNYNFRLFIDESIYKDSEIMNIINKLNKLEIVLFKYDRLKLNGLFPTLIRFFPMFNFPNNDANIVIPIDIDDSHIINIDKEFTNIKHIINTNIINNTYLIKFGTLNKNIIYNYHFIYKNTITVYAYAKSIINIKKIDYNIIINFINKVVDSIKLNEPIKNYSYHYNRYNWGNTLAEELEFKINPNKPFVYGVDEYFLNNTLTKYLIKKNLLTINHVKFNSLLSIFWYRLHFYNNNSLREFEIKNLKKIFTLLLNKINYKKNIKSKSLNEILNILEKISNNNKQYMKIIYEYIISNYNNDLLKPYYHSDLINILLQPENKNVYKFKKIIFSNPKYKNITINEQRF